MKKKRKTGNAPPPPKPPKTPVKPPELPPPPPPPPPTPPNPQPPRERLGLLRTATSVLLGAITIASLVVAFVPRPIVVEGAPDDPHDSLSATFTITNNTIIPIHKVVVFIETCNIKVFSGPSPMAPITLTAPDSRDGGNCRQYDKNGFVFKEWQHETLEGDERQPIRLDDIFKSVGITQGEDADIGISIAYQPWFLPINRHKVFRFITKRDARGNIHWIPMPLDMYIKQQR